MTRTGRIIWEIVSPEEAFFHTHGVRPVTEDVECVVLESKLNKPTKVCDCNRKYDHTANFICDNNCKI